jgi:enoyl-CoA hydratase
VKRPEGTRVTVEDREGVRRIRFGNPATLNALTEESLREINEAVGSIGGRAGGIVFVGDGDRAFSSGMHLGCFRDLDGAGARQLIGCLRETLTTVRTCPVPTVAAINGDCLGAAFELALVCDGRIAVPSARFGLPEVKVGVPSVLDASLLVDHVGLSLAREMMLSGDLYDCEALQRFGVLNGVVARKELDRAAGELLRRFGSHDPSVVEAQKRIFESWLNVPHAVGLMLSAEEFVRTFERDRSHNREVPTV